MTLTTGALAAGIGMDRLWLCLRDRYKDDEADGHGGDHHDDDCGDDDDPCRGEEHDSGSSRKGADEDEGGFTWPRPPRTKKRPGRRI